MRPPRPQWVRVVRETALYPLPRKRVRAPDDVRALMAPYAEAELIEVMWGLALDSQSNVREITELSRGCLNSTIVTPGLVFGWACSVYAAGIILVHNHPSGDPTPSPEDRTITAQLVRASEIIDIPLYDHLIIGSNGRFNAAAASGWL